MISNAFNFLAIIVIMVAMGMILTMEVVISLELIEWIKGKFNGK